MAILKKFIGANQVDGSKILFSNNESFRAKDALGATVEIFKLDSSDTFKMYKLPRMDASAPAVSDAKDLTTKEYVDNNVSSAVTDLIGEPNGIASLDGSGKVPVTQLPNAIMEYQGMWNASTNTPALSNAGNAPEALGNVYKVSVGGSVDFGAGSIAFEAGDYVILGASGWEKSDATDAVVSVNGMQGAVVLDSDDVSEGSTNLYFTNARAKAASVADAIVDGVTDVAPSQNAVFDALALKASIAYVDGEVAALEGEDLTFVKLDGSRTMTGALFMGGFGIAQLADPVVSHNAANKNYVDGEITTEANARIAGDTATLGSAQSYTDAQLDLLSIKQPEFVQKTLTALEISDGYVSLLPHSPVGIPHITVGRVALEHGVDFTISGPTITFIGPVAAAGAEALEEGDKLSIHYHRSISPYV